MSTVTLVTALDLLLQLLDRTSQAANLIRRAREEGRDVTLEELQGIKDQGAALLADLDAAIARAKAETP